MTLEEFQKSVLTKTPPPVSDALLALWHDAQGNWERAHEIAQDLHTAEGAWIHAYLHRKEGDASNAQYWYRQANQPMPAYSLAEEWEEITRALLIRKA